MIKEVLLLGNEELYQTSEPIETGTDITNIIDDLHDTLIDFRERHQAGRAIAAPQIGVNKRVLYMYIDTPIVFINPVLEFPDNEKMEVTDDCMSFPGLYVKVRRYKRCCIKYYDQHWQKQELSLEGDLAELLQHEYDHLDGILATMRAIDDKSLFINR